MTYLIKRDDALAAIQEYAVQEVGAFRTPNLKGAADAIEDIPAIDFATIREDALLEAAALSDALAVKWWAIYKDRRSAHGGDPQFQGMSDGAEEVTTAIKALIGEKK